MDYEAGPMHPITALRQLKQSGQLPDEDYLEAVRELAERIYAHGEDVFTLLAECDAAERTIVERVWERQLTAVEPRRVRRSGNRVAVRPKEVIAAKMRIDRMQASGETPDPKLVRIANAAFASATITPRQDDIVLAQWKVRLDREAGRATEPWIVRLSWAEPGKPMSVIEPSDPCVTLDTEAAAEAIFRAIREE